MKKITPLMKLFLLTITVWSAFFTSCTQPTSGGTGTETVNTFAKLPDGTPAAGAEVKLIDATWWADSIRAGHSPVISSGVADSNGFCSVQMAQRRGDFNIQIDHAEYGILHRVKEKERADIDTLILGRYGSVVVYIDSTDTLPEMLYLAGTDYHQLADNRMFSLPAIPAGTFELIGTQKDSSGIFFTSDTSITVEEGKEVLLKDSTPTNKRLLLDDFETGIGPTALDTSVPGLGWYVHSDSLYYFWDTNKRTWSKGVTVVIAHSPISFDSVMIEGSKAFTFATRLDQTSSIANALIGISLSPLRDSGVDLSKMSACSFTAAGTGTIRIQFETTGLEKAGFTHSHYGRSIALSSTMTTYTVPIDSLRLSNALTGTEYYTWARESRRVVRIVFDYSPTDDNLGKDLTMTLDDFYLEGITLNNILGQLE